MLIDGVLLRLVLPYANDFREWLYFIIGVPILAVNTWVWFEPDVIESFFIGFEENPL